MSGDIAAAGDIITGALAASAVEPVAGSHGGHGPALCLNCGTRLIGAHCHACGQGGHVHRTIGAIGHEIAHGVFHFEGKIWKTLPLLVWRPGDLTRRYVQGERVRFVSPLALFLFTVFLMFATISAVGGEFGGTNEANPRQAAKVQAEFDRQLGDARAKLDRIDAQREALKAANRPTDKLDEDRTTARLTVRGLELASTNLTSGITPRFTDMKTGWARLDHGIAKANANPGLALYKLQSSAYKYSWLLIPLSTPFVALLFLWRRRFGLYDHAIFVTYSLAFMMLMTVVLTLLGVAGLASGWISLAVFVIPPLHMYRQLRGAYSLTRFSALWRTAGLLVFAWAALLSFVVLLLLHGLTE